MSSSKDMTNEMQIDHQEPQAPDSNNLVEPPPTWGFLVWRDQYRKKARQLERDRQIALSLEQEEKDQEFSTSNRSQSWLQIRPATSGSFQFDGLQRLRLQRTEEKSAKERYRRLAELLEKAAEKKESEMRSRSKGKGRETDDAQQDVSLRYLTLKMQNEQRERFKIPPDPRRTETASATLERLRGKGKESKAVTLTNSVSESDLEPSSDYVSYVDKNGNLHYYSLDFIKRSEKSTTLEEEMVNVTLDEEGEKERHDFIRRRLERMEISNEGTTSSRQRVETEGSQSENHISSPSTSTSSFQIIGSDVHSSDEWEKVDL